MSNIDIVSLSFPLVNMTNKTPPDFDFLPLIQSYSQAKARLAENSQDKKLQGQKRIAETRLINAILKHGKFFPHQSTIDQIYHESYIELQEKIIQTALNKIDEYNPNVAFFLHG